MALRWFDVALSAWLHQRETEALASLLQENRTLREPREGNLPGPPGCGKFGPDDARRLKRRQGRLGDTWFLDEVFVAINGQRQYLWRAVDQDGDLIDLLVRSPAPTGVTHRPRQAGGSCSQSS